MDQPSKFERVDEIVSELKSIATKAFQEGQAFDQTERILLQQLMKLGQELLNSAIKSAGDGDVGPTVEKNGCHYKQLRKRSRRYRSIFGDLQ